MARLISFTKSLIAFAATILFVAMLIKASSLSELAAKLPSELKQPLIDNNQESLNDDKQEEGEDDSIEDIPHVETVNTMSVNVDKKVDNTNINLNPIENNDYNGAKITPTQVNQVLVGTIKNQQTRIARAPTKEEVEIYNKVLYIFNEARLEYPPGKYTHQLHRILEELNPKYIATWKIYDVVNANADDLWAEHVNPQNKDSNQVDDDDEDDEISSPLVDAHQDDQEEIDEIYEQLLKEENANHLIAN